MRCTRLIRILILQHIQSFRIEALRVGVEDGCVQSGELTLFDSIEVLPRGPFEKARAVGIGAIDLVENVARECDRYLDSHKVVMLQNVVYLRSAQLNPPQPPLLPHGRETKDRARRIS